MASLKQLRNHLSSFNYSSFIHSLPPLHLMRRWEKFFIGCVKRKKWKMFFLLKASEKWNRFIVIFYAYLKNKYVKKRIAINAAVTHLKTFLSSASPGINSSQTHNDVVSAHKEQNSHYKRFWNVWKLVKRLLMHGWSHWSGKRAWPNDWSSCD